MMVRTYTHGKQLITKDTIIHFQKILSNETWDTIYLNDDINGTFNALFEHLSEHI